MRLFRPKQGVVLVIVITISSALLWNCQTEKYPDNILSQEEFSSLLMELYLAEAKLNGLSIPRDSASKLFIPYEDSLMRKSGVPDSILRNTYQYYFDHPQELEKVYEIVIDSLSLREKKDQKKPIPIN